MKRHTTMSSLRLYIRRALQVKDQWRIQRPIQMQALPKAFHSHNQDNV